MSNIIDESGSFFNNLTLSDDVLHNFYLNIKNV